MFDIKEELKKVPEKPGVYLMHDADDKIIYVGKAIILRNRLRSYFNNSPHNERITRMISLIRRFEYIVTDSEYEALLLECNLIKKHRPKYNVLLKDDKNYPYIKVTAGERFPRVFMAHKAVKDGSRYFGPYYSSYAVKSTLDTLYKNFPLRQCRKKISENTCDRVCLNYHIGLCQGACAGYISEEDYNKNVDSVCDFLSGRSSDMIKKLKEEMALAASDLNFEKAASLRDRIKALEIVSEKQKVTLSGESDFDVAAVAVNQTDACVQVFFVRGGRILGRDFYIFEGAGNTEHSEIVTSFIKQFYDNDTLIPRRIYSETELPESERILLEEMISRKAEHRVEIITPQRGEKKSLAAMVHQNAELALKNYEMTKNADDGGNLIVLEKLKELAETEKLPIRIEAFDISNQGDTEINGSMVVFVKGKPCKSEYKRFKMKTVETRNDTASMREMLERRYTRLVNGDKGFEKRPDLILMDGGLGQIHAACDIMEKLGLDIPILGMVKDNKHRSRGLMDRYGKEFILEEDPDVWRFITGVQNETHRFAIEYNRKLSEKRYKKSVIDGIAGVGEKRKLALLKHFGSVAAIRRATKEQVAQVDGIGERLAEEILKSLCNDDSEKKQGGSRGR